MATLNRYAAALKAIALAPSSHCLECGRRVEPGDVVCTRCTEPRMRRLTADRAGGYQALAAAAERLG